jgi:hypothetical protein
MKHNPSGSPRPIGKKVLIPVLILMLLAALAVCLRLFSSPFPRLEVAGFRISQEEYVRAMYQARNDVLSDHAAAGISLKDWGTETALGDPYRLTMERALEILSEYYAVGTLAVERGYLADASYEAMQKDMADVNEKRQEALNSGGIVTGIPTFTTNDYLTYRASSIRLQFCNDGENPENQLTDEEILQRYEADRDSLYRQPDALELAFLRITDPEEARALVPELQALRQLALEKGGLAPALEEMPGLKAYFEEISVDPATYSTYARSHSDILAYSEELGTGDLSQVIDLDGWLCLIECRERIDHDYIPLEDVRSIVEQSIREDRYDALIAERMAQTQTEGDLDRLYRFTAEQLP